MSNIRRIEDKMIPTHEETEKLAFEVTKANSLKAKPLKKASKELLAGIIDWVD